MTEAEARRARRPLPDLDSELVPPNVRGLPPNVRGFSGQTVQLIALPTQLPAAYAEGEEVFDVLEQVEAAAKGL